VCLSPSFDVMPGAVVVSLMEGMEEGMQQGHLGWLGPSPSGIARSAVACPTQL
jgi:hypothetical protein